MKSLLNTGLYYGYPECCIKEFIEDHPLDFLRKYKDIDSEKIRRQQELELKRKVSKGSGFIPCFHHAKQIEAGEIKLEELIRNRQHIHTFPKGCGKPVKSQN